MIPEMTPEQIDQAALLLAAAHGGAPLTELPQSCRPQSDADAYAIQDAVMRRLGARPGGWKVGAASTQGPAFFAPIFATAVHPSPVTLPARGFHLIGIEAEIGFRLDRTLPRRERPYGRDEVAAAVAMHPTLEIVDSRFHEPRALPRPVMLADNYINGGLIWGAAVAGWQDRDLVNPPITVTADGAPFAESTGARSADPIGVLTEAVNHVATRLGEIAAGSFVTTGSHTGLVFTEPGVRIVADFGAYGRIEAAFPR